MKTCDDDMMIGKLLDELPDRFAHFQSSFALGLSTGTVKDLKFADIVKHLIQVEEQMEKGAIGSGGSTSAASQSGNLKSVKSEQVVQALKADSTCHGCGGTGHWKRDCPSLKSGRASKQTRGKFQKTHKSGGSGSGSFEIRLQTD